MKKETKVKLAKHYLFILKVAAVVLPNTTAYYFYEFTTRDNARFLFEWDFWYGSFMWIGVVYLILLFYKSIRLAMKIKGE